MALSNIVDGVRAGRKRRSWSVAEKRRIVDESLVGGASIAEVARRHDLNANQLFTWRRHFDIEPRDSDPNGPASILPVMIVAETAASGHGKPGQVVDLNMTVQIDAGAPPLRKLPILVG